MIYDPCGPGDPIRQGDLFANVPRLVAAFERLTVRAPNDEDRQATWLELVADGQFEPAPVWATVSSTNAIVITQDCDAEHRAYISLCEIDRYVALVRTEPTSVKKWRDLILRRSQEQLRYFYLPMDPAVAQYPERMGVDFGAVLSVPRSTMLTLRRFRRARLNEEAYQHFRESLAQYFRRYPVDEWYPLSREEFASYVEDYPGTPPRAYQRPGAPAEAT